MSKNNDTRTLKDSLPRSFASSWLEWTDEWKRKLPAPGIAALHGRAQQPLLRAAYLALKEQNMTLRSPGWTFRSMALHDIDPYLTARLEEVMVFASSLMDLWSRQSSDEGVWEYGRDFLNRLRALHETPKIVHGKARFGKKAARKHAPENKEDGSSFLKWEARAEETYKEGENYAIALENQLCASCAILHAAMHVDEVMRKETTAWQKKTDEENDEQDMTIQHALTSVVASHAMLTSMITKVQEWVDTREALLDNLLRMTKTHHVATAIEHASGHMKQQISAMHRAIEWISEPNEDAKNQIIARLAPPKRKQPTPPHGRLVREHTDDEVFFPITESLPSRSRRWAWADVRVVEQEMTFSSAADDEVFPKTESPLLLGRRSAWAHAHVEGHEEGCFLTDTAVLQKKDRPLSGKEGENKDIRQTRKGAPFDNGHDEPRLKLRFRDEDDAGETKILWEALWGDVDYKERATTEGVGGACLGTRLKLWTRAVAETGEGTDSTDSVAARWGDASPKFRREVVRSMLKDGWARFIDENRFQALSSAPCPSWFVPATCSWKAAMDAWLVRLDGAVWARVMKAHDVLSDLMVLVIDEAQRDLWRNGTTEDARHMRQGFSERVRDVLVWAANSPNVVEQWGLLPLFVAVVDFLDMPDVGVSKQKSDRTYTSCTPLNLTIEPLMEKARHDFPAYCAHPFREYAIVAMQRRDEDDRHLLRDMSPWKEGSPRWFWIRETHELTTNRKEPVVELVEPPKTPWWQLDVRIDGK